MINPPSITKKIKIGKSHHFLRIFKNAHNSETIDNLLMYLPCGKLSFKNGLTNSIKTVFPYQLVHKF
jgi:hypothetical protein